MRCRDSYCRSAADPFGETYHHERTVRIDGGERKGDRFEFPGTLATDGEAADGHILSIEGARIPSRMPLLTAHWNDPTGTLGSIVKPERDLAASPKRLRVVGQIELTGDSPSADIRRDIALMIEKRHVGALSVRWDAIVPPIARRDLPEDHPAHIDSETEKDVRKRWGLFFPKWRGLEGSVVAVGADAEALIGRAEELGDGPVAQFWRDVALASEMPARSRDEAAGLLVEALSSAREAGVGGLELYQALADVLGDEWQEIPGTRLRAPASIVALIARHEPEEEIEEESAPALEPLEPEEVAIPPQVLASPARVVLSADALKAVLADHRAQSRQDLADMLRRATGRT